MTWLPARLDAPRAALLATALLLIAILAIPFTRAGVLESLSVKLGKWYYWIPGYTDAHNWVPNEKLPEAVGPNAVLISAYLEENGKSGGKYVLSHPNDLRLRALYIRRTLRDKSMSLVNTVDYPYGQPDPEGERKQAQYLAELQAKIPTVLAAAIEGERQEPDNGFFPLAQAIAYESLRDRKSSRKALERAVECSYYNDYWYATWTTFNSAGEPHIYDRLYAAMHAEPELTREMFHFANRLSHETDSEGLIMKGLLLDCLTRIGSQAATASEFASVKWAIRGVIPFKSLYPRELGRSRNDGDTFRELTLLQSDIVAAGYTPRADLPAFYGTEIRGWWFDSEGNQLSKWDETSYFALLKYEGAVIAGMFVIECFLGLLAIVPLLFILTKIKSPRWPHMGIPPLIAFATTVVNIAMDPRLLDSMVFVGACFLLAFVFSLYVKAQRLSIALGVMGVFGALLSGTLLLRESSGGEFLPAVVYVIAMARALWIRGRTGLRGWIFSTIGLAVIAIGAASVFPISFVERMTTYLPAVLFVLLGVSLWYRCHIGDAAKRLLRAAPTALLAGTVALLGISVLHHTLVNEMKWLITVEKEMAENGRNAASEIGPPRAGRLAKGH